MYSVEEFIQRVEKAKDWFVTEQESALGHLRSVFVELG